MKESDIKRLICEWLELQGCFFWVQSAGKIPGRIGKSRFQRNGIADILGVWKGKPLAIEVKTPEGKLSCGQKEFLSKFAEAGGVAIVARSLDEAIDSLRAVDKGP